MRMRILKTPDQSNQTLIEQSADEGQSQSGFFTLTHSADGLRGAVELIQDGPGILQKQSSGIRQCNRMGIPLQQAGVQFVLKRLDVPGERRLGQIKLLGGPGKIEMIRHGNETLQFPDVRFCHA